MNYEEFQNAIMEEWMKVGRGDDMHYLTAFSYLLGGLEGKHILDIGCGAEVEHDINKRGKTWFEHCDEVEIPKFCKHAHKKGAKVVGIDPRIKPETVEFEAYSLGTWDLHDSFQEDSFDGVFIKRLWSNPPSLRNPVDEFLERQRKTYMEIYRILKPGGISISVMNEDKGLRPGAPSRLIEQQPLEDIGFNIVLYHKPKEDYEDWIVLKK